MIVACVRFFFSFQGPVNIRVTRFKINSINMVLREWPLSSSLNHEYLHNIIYNMILYRVINLMYGHPIIFQRVLIQNIILHDVKSLQNNVFIKKILFINICVLMIFKFFFLRNLVQF